MAKRHDFQGLPDGSRQCSKCLEVRVLGAMPLVRSEECPFARDEVKVKGEGAGGGTNLSHDQFCSILKEIGVDPGEFLGEAPAPRVMPGKDFLGSIGLSLEDLGL